MSAKGEKGDSTSLFRRRPSLPAELQRPPLWGALVVSATAFIVYLVTMPSSITWRHDGADGGELATAAYRLGIPHPPGYPTYVLVGRLFTLLPWGDVAHRLSLMSALFAAFACGLVFLVAWRCLEAPEGWPGLWVAALGASLSLALSRILVAGHYRRGLCSECCLCSDNCILGLS